eukprot:6770335-Lingulodinium_polyedra.AAC.1
MNQWLAHCFLLDFLYHTSDPFGWEQLLGGRATGRQAGLPARAQPPGRASPRDETPGVYVGRGSPSLGLARSP